MTEGAHFQQNKKIVNTGYKRKRIAVLQNTQIMLDNALQYTTKFSTYKTFY